MTTVAPNKVVLTCTVSGKTVTWTNKTIIQKKIDQFGSLEAFQAQYVAKGANNNKKEKTVTAALKPILQEGVAMGKMTKEEYDTKYVTRTFSFKDGPSCTVSSPKVVTSSEVV